VLWRKNTAQVYSGSNNQFLDAFERSVDGSLICKQPKPSRAKPRWWRMQQNFAAEAKLLGFPGLIMADHFYSIPLLLFTIRHVGGCLRALKNTYLYNRLATLAPFNYKSVINIFLTRTG
jgi:hypothetical protein